MSPIFKILSGVAVAGLIATGGSAFTAAGLDPSGTAAASSQFVGGMVSQNVYGVGLSDIEYTVDGDAVTGVKLTFSGSIEEIDALDALQAGDPTKITVVPYAGAVAQTGFTSASGVVQVGTADEEVSATATYTGSVTNMTSLRVLVDGAEVVAS
jgi:hypothetical protein